MPTSSGCPQATFDVSEYVVDIAKREGLAPGLEACRGGVALHIACHARAQNMGQKAAEMLRLHPRGRRRGDRALLGPWRLLGRDEGEFRHRAQGRQAGRAPAAQDRQGASSPRNVRSPASISCRASSASTASPPPERRRIPSSSSPAPTEPEHGPQDHPRRHPAAAADYAGQAARSCRQALVAMKRVRRIEVGPVATLHFESFDTMCMQVQEMLYIEKGGDEQIDDELAAYNPLVPDGHELVATVLFEIDDPQRRANPSSAASAASRRPPSSRSPARPSTACRRPIRTAPPPRARPPRAVHPFPLHARRRSPRSARRGRRCARLPPSGLRPYGVMPEPVRQALAGDFD